MIDLPPPLQRGVPPRLREWLNHLRDYAAASRPIPGPACNVYRGTNGSLIDPIAPPSTGGEGQPITRNAWDLVIKEGVGSPDEQGNYSSYTCKFWPGMVGGLVPGNMFSSLPVSGSGTQYLVADVQTGDGRAQSVALDIENTAPLFPAQTLDAPPTAFKHTLGVFVDGNYWRVQNGNVFLSVQESLRVSDPTASPFGLPYKSYYVWSVG